MRMPTGRVARSLAVLGSVGALVAAPAVFPRRTAAELPQEPSALARSAVSDDAELAVAARGALRALGQRGLDALLATHRRGVERLRRDPAASTDPALARLRDAIDRVSGQRDAFASGLYWYTDLEQAKAEATRSGRPILSLRLLGRLDEELSCANSRLFRTVLYPDREVRELLRQSFVLHWSSERPVPVVRIDLGDGRTLVRTLTGNSAHYVLDARGRPIDVLPGLYGAPAFARALRTAVTAAERCALADDAARDACVVDWHRSARAAQDQAWARMRAGASTALPPLLASLSLTNGFTQIEIPALGTDRMTMGKSAMEQPILRGIDRQAQQQQQAVVARPWWEIVARAEDGRLDDRSITLIRMKSGDRFGDALLARLRGDVSRDTVRNELVLHRQVHDMFVADPTVRAFERLNRRVYDELFETPQSDPWLGLRPDDVFDAIEL